VCSPAPCGGRLTDLRSHPVDVLVIGAGGAGLRAAIAAHEAGCEVVVVSERARVDAHTVLASGGINAALGTRNPEDSWEQHFADTMREGYLLGQPGTISRASSTCARALTLRKPLCKARSLDARAAAATIDRTIPTSIPRFV
jgi:succinate dehydrogenase/fumarate reductase flavoprotein subunit